MWLLILVFIPNVWSYSLCSYQRNVTVFGQDSGQEEMCLYYYLAEKDYEKTLRRQSLAVNPPDSKELKINVEDVITRHVELAKGSSYQFNVYGDIYLNWQDKRLSWDKEGEWKDMDHFFLVNSSRIWSPHLVDHSLCLDDSCHYTLEDVDIYSGGDVYARIQFRYLSSCEVNYYKFPEEDDHCCVYFTSFEPLISKMKMEVQTEQKIKLNRPVYAEQVFENDEKLYSLAQEHSPWTLKEQHVSVSHLGGIESLEVLQVCIRASKQMSTVRLGITLPATIATVTMLLSPLFGDLRQQLFVKLFVLLLQTICFLYLCSITPANGFLGVRPQIYLRYEFIFTTAFLSITVTLFCMAMSRPKRTYPPYHRIFLLAKLFNTHVCCIEPDRADAYQRYIEESAVENPIQRPNNEQDHTNDWRHLYLAFNNFVSLIFLFFFFIVIIFI